MQSSHSQNSVKTKIQTRYDHEESEINQSKIKLPIASKNIVVRAYNPDCDYSIMKKWMEDKYSRLFLLSRDTAKTMSLEALTKSENNIFGMNADKRVRLINAGADIIILNYKNQDRLIEYLFQQR